MPESFCFFFLQAEDGIRGFHVTGVQTCALPISPWGFAASTQSVRLGSSERVNAEAVSILSHAMPVIKTNGISTMTTTIRVRLRIRTYSSPSVAANQITASVMYGIGTSLPF